MRTLKAACVPENRAEAYSEAFKNAQSDAELAPKYGLIELELRLEAKINEVHLIWSNGYGGLFKHTCPVIVSPFSVKPFFIHQFINATTVDSSIN